MEATARARVLGELPERARKALLQAGAAGGEDAALDILTGARLLDALAGKNATELEAHVVLAKGDDLAAAAAALSAGLSIRGSLVVVDKFEGEDVALPGDLCIGGDLLVLDSAEVLAGLLPRRLRIGGSLRCSGCSSLTQLPPNLQVEGDLDATFCTSLAGLPEGFRVGGALLLARCYALGSLPGDIHVGGDIKLMGCSALTSLGGLLASGKSLDCYGCVRLAGLPEGLRVGSDLTLTGCSALRRLPARLRVERDLLLDCCTNLATVLEGLFVGRNMRAGTCLALTALPEDLYVGGDLTLERCASLESLPASILQWPVREDSGEPHNIILVSSGLPSDTLEWLREANAPGLRFHVMARADRRRPDFASARVAAAFWTKEAGVPEAFVPMVDDDVRLVRFLSRLRDAREFGIAATRTSLAKRIVAVLELLAQGEVNEELLMRMGDSLDACGDKPVWALNQMHLVVEVAKAQGDREVLRDLGRRVMRLMVVHEHAKRKVDSLRWVDDVCVYLRFEIELREALDLPVDATAMLFPTYIDVTEKELEAAREDALAITDDQFEAWLVEWPEWQRQQRHEVTGKLKWEELPELPKRECVSRRLGLMQSVTGDKVGDPVTLDGGKSVWSLGDLLRHWEQMGQDLYNNVVSPQQLQTNLRRLLVD